MSKAIKHNNFINTFKMRNFFPFYIENVNEKFFSTVKTTNRKFNSKSNIYQKIINDLDKEEIVKFNDSQAILNHDNIQSLLNQIVWKIVAKTGNNKYDFFVSEGTTAYGHPMYVSEKNEIYDLKIIGNTFSQKRYIYSVYVDKNSYLFDFVEQIQIVFFVDDKNKTISGGFSLNTGNEKLLNSFQTIIENIYVNSVLKNFIKNEFTPISVNNILSIIDIYSEMDFSSNDTKTIMNKKSIETFKRKWERFLDEKLFSEGSNFSKMKKYYCDDLFYSFINVLLSCLTIYEELRKYFTSKEPEIFLPLFKRVEYVKINDDQTPEQDFFELINLIKNRYFYFTSSKKELKNIKNADEAIEALIKFDQMENQSFGNITTSYELTRNIDIPFLDEDDDIFMNSKELKTIFLLIFNPSLLGINHYSLDFLDYNNFLKNINEINFNDSWNEMLEKIVDKTICEWNYDYVTFVDSYFSNLIIKNYNPINVSGLEVNEIYDIDPNRKLYNNYLWAFVYTKTLLWKFTDIEGDMQIDKVERPWKLREYLNQLELLRLDWYDSFYGIPQIKVIVKKIDSFYSFNSLNKILKDKITKEDKLYGKGKERKNLAATFVSAVIFGLLDFFTTVFSILTVDSTSEGLSTVNIIMIAVGTVFASCLFAVLFYKLISPLISKRKNKQYY